MKDKEIHDSLKVRKEEILDVIQNLCDLVRFLDRSNGADNKEFWVDYLEFAYTNFNLIFSPEIRDYLLYRKFQRQFEEKGGLI